MFQLLEGLEQLVVVAIGDDRGVKYVVAVVVRVQHVLKLHGKARCGLGADVGEKEGSCLRQDGVRLRQEIGHRQSGPLLVSEKGFHRDPIEDEQVRRIA